MRWSLFVLPGALAFNFPFKIPNLFASTIVPTTITAHSENAPSPSVPRIAIIGAGAGGSSAAFWLSKAKTRLAVDFEIDVYESKDYIGGRSTVVYPYANSSLPELELGASIFVQANKNLWRASDEFNLTRRDFHEEDYESGIWDGQNMLFSFNGGWWDTAKMLWRYGFTSPKRTESFVQSIIKKFLSFYTSDAPSWENISNLANTLDWAFIVNSTTEEYLQTYGISQKYIGEVVEAATRVNYGQNTDFIHALEGAASMAASGATGIAGGNFQIFENFIAESGANVYLNTTVTHVSSATSSSNSWTVKSTRGKTDYKAVILAAPFHSTGINLPFSLAEQIPEQPYVHLHVTLLSTTSPTPNPKYFGLAPSSPAPRVILTTNQGKRGGGVEPEFNSLSYHGLVREGEWAVKIFSDHELSDEWLNEMFQDKVGWVYRKEWDAYPKLPPTSVYPPVKLDLGFYYVNSFEPFISTMETETISSRNIVDLLFHEEFNAGICGANPSILPVESDLGSQQVLQPPEVEKKSESESFVLGWDC